MINVRRSIVLINNFMLYRRAFPTVGGIARHLRNLTISSSRSACSKRAQLAIECTLDTGEGRVGEG